MNTNIAQITMSPLFTNWEALAHLFKETNAVILSGYGMGNLPIDNQFLMNTIREAIEAGGRSVDIFWNELCAHANEANLLDRSESWFGYSPR